MKKERRLRKNAMLLVDSYKLGHITMYPKGTEVIYGNLTPRSTRHLDKVLVPKYNDGTIVMYGSRLAIEELKETFDTWFFELPLEEVLADVEKAVKPFIGDNSPEGILTAVENLHKLQYLPVLIKWLPDGTLSPAGIPMMTIKSTHPDFSWLPQYLEDILSSETWKKPTAATIARHYRLICEDFAEQTCDNNFHVPYQGHDFSPRGMSGIDDFFKTGTGHLTQFQGSDNVSAAYLIENIYTSQALVACSVPACYDDITEVLTDNGFKLFKDLTKEDKVAQYLPDGSIEFVIPTEYYNMPYKGTMVRYYTNGYSYVDCVVTPNHKMVRLNKTKGIQLFEAGYKEESRTTGYNSTNNVVVSGVLKGDTKLSDMEKLAIAFQADGSLPNRSEAYKSGQIRFSFKKQRKIDRLDSILSGLNLEFSKSEADKKGYVNYWIKTNEQFFDKEFSWVKLTNGDTWAKDFINELKFWDGTTKSNCIVYSNTNEAAVKKVMEICSVSGYKSQYISYFDKRGSRLLQHTIVIQDKQTLYGKNTKREFIDYDSTVHCVSVPSKMIITKRNNRVIICGNTEHSVMQLASSSETEVETFRRLIKQYNKGIVSIVSDTWDFWDTITVKALELKDEILAREEDSLGLSKVVFRPDSGDPVDVICGYVELKSLDVEENGWTNTHTYELNTKSYVYKKDNKYYKVFFANDSSDYIDELYIEDGFEVPEAEVKGAIECLWDTFGGTVNSKEFKVLNPKVGLIYGDSITPQRAVDIFTRLKAKGFASSNVVLGIGSFTYQYITRDSLGFAMKATYAEINGEAFNIFKSPKTDSGKKSAKGLLRVDSIDGKLVLKQECTKEEELGGLLEIGFCNGWFIEDAPSWDDIRARAQA